MAVGTSTGQVDTMINFVLVLKRIAVVTRSVVNTLLDCRAQL